MRQVMRFVLPLGLLVLGIGVGVMLSYYLPGNRPVWSIQYAIAEPAQGAELAGDKPVHFKATTESNQPIRLVWTSDLDGELARNEASFSKKLSPGVHVVSLEIRNDREQAVFATRRIVVQ